MSSPGVTRTRIAVVAAHETDLGARLGALAHPLLVRRYDDLYADAAAIHRFDAAALFVVAHSVGDEEAGALRMVQALQADLSVVLVCDPDDEVQQRALASRIGAAILVTPFSSGQLAAVLDSAVASTPRPSAEALLDLARGISDEINNPLMFVDGHLQLLQRTLQDEAHRPGLEQVEMIREGLERIRRTMERVRLLAQAGDADTSRQPVDLGRLAHHLAASSLAVTAPTVPDSAVVRGDAELLAALLDHLGRVAAALLEAGGDARLQIAAGPGNVVITALVDARSLPTWQLPRTFEPYYLTRILRGTPHGLSLFLVQVIAQTHGGRAMARWTQSGELALEVELPRSHGAA